MGARSRAGQWLPLCPPFRASWHKAIRPFAPFPPPPLKFRTVGFPQYGFKLAPATATFAPRAYRPPLCLLSECGVCSVVGFRQAAPHPSDRTTSPVALGSASGCSVRQPLRLLWPHPSLCRPRRVYELIPAAAQPAEVPQFTLPELDSMPPSLLRWLQDADRRACAPDLAFTHPVGVRQPLDPHTGLRVVVLTKLQHSLNAAAWNLAGPAPDGTFTTELACARSLRRTSVMTT